MQWYYAKENQRQGPVGEAELAQLVASGAITPDTLVWRQGMANWQPYATVAPAAATTGTEAGVIAATAAAGADDTEVCAVSGKRYPKREMLQFDGKWISAEHRDQYFQRLQEGVGPTDGPAVPGPYGYGGFWRRFLARFVDGLILGVIGMVVGAVAGAVFAIRAQVHPGNARTGFLLLQVTVQTIQFVIGCTYAVFFIRKFDATPGKMAVGLKLLRANGEKLSIGRIIGREFAYILSAIVLLIGYIMAAFDPERRALHDRICDTRVVKTRA